MLRLITLGQLSYSINSSSYAHDDAEQLVSFIESGEAVGGEKVEDTPDIEEAPETVLTAMAENAFEYVCGWLVFKSEHESGCGACVDLLRCTDSVEDTDGIDGTLI
jgi:hypothetical protein